MTTKNLYHTQMVDLKSQYAKIKDEVLEEVEKVLDSASFIKGPAVHEFEKSLANYLGAGHVIGCANGTDAIQLALMALDLEEGAEVLVPDFTFIATAEVVALLGLTPVFVDVSMDDFNIDTNDLRAKITDRSRAIMAVHLFGQCARMDEIMSIAQEFNLYVVEDAAQSIGAKYYGSFGTEGRRSGTIGHIGTTSFFPSKNLGAFGDGGAVFTNDDTLAEKIRVLANHGMEVRYYHDMIGINSRLDSVQAAILNVKLKYLEGYNKARRAAADSYDELLGDVEALVLPHRSRYSDHIFHQYTMRVVDGSRDALHQYLQEHNIPNAIYYPVPLHQQKAFRDRAKSTSANLDNSIQLCSEVLSLPMHTELRSDEQGYIAGLIKEFYQK